MQVDRTRIGLAVLLTALVFGALALLYWDFFRDTVVLPIYYLLWVGDLILKAIPQGACLGVLVVVGMMIGVSTLRNLPSNTMPTNRVTPHPQTRSHYHQWRSLCEKMHTSQFSRNQFQSDARRLVLAIVAYDHGLEIWEAEALINSGALTVPEAIKQLVERQEIQVPQPPFTRLRNLLRRLGLLESNAPRDSQLERLVAEFIALIEQHGEITYGGHRPQS